MVRLVGAVALLTCMTGLVSASADPDDHDTRAASADEAHAILEAKMHRGLDAADQVSGAAKVAKNFEVLGHLDFGRRDTNADVFVHHGFAYVGTWGSPCSARGVKIADVSAPRDPRFVGTLAHRTGTSAEDVVVRSVSTEAFTGDLLAVGIQRCGARPIFGEQKYGAQFWDVTNPRRPVKLGGINMANGGGGVHELDLVQRGGKVYALLATPFTEWFDPQQDGDFRIVDVTNPRNPRQVGEWGAAEHGLSPGPFYGQGSFGASYDHSVRASANGKRAYVSYWDLGVLTLNISDVTRPRLVSRTRYRPSADGDAHSVSTYHNGDRKLLLQNDEDFDPRSPAELRYAGRRIGFGSESPQATALWAQPRHRISGRVVRASGQGCSSAAYPAGTAGSIAVVKTLFSALGNPQYEPRCRQVVQERAAKEAGAIAVVHDWRSPDTSPQWFSTGRVGIPVVFAERRDVAVLANAGRGTLQARRPSWGYMRIFDAATGQQVAKFDRVPHVHALPAPDGFWSIHNNEVVGHRSYVSWYSNGIVALDLRPLRAADPRSPERVGQFVPPGNPEVWGVAVRGGRVYASDMNSGLWILRPTGEAAP
jgi:hypothetical protein